MLFSNFEQKKYLTIDSINFKYLLNRDEIKIKNCEEIKNLVNKNILVTGGFGSIGSHIVKKLNKIGSNIIIYDNNECNYFNLKNELGDKNIQYILGDINDFDKLETIFKNNKIDIIYHVAAYKHVSILEDNGYESVKVNIVGTKNIADLSIKYKISKFIFVSTDKAVNPTNIMGLCKRISELYINYLWENYKTTIFIITRFGNVLGSSGSIIPIFIKRINENKNLQITHKDITRYFMTINEASKIVIISSCICNENNIVIFDMGKPIKIYDLAIKLLNYLNIKNLNIEYIGLKKGEKIHEELYYKNEQIEKILYNKIIFLKNIKFDYNEFIKNYNILLNVTPFHSNNYIKELLNKIINF